EVMSTAILDGVIFAGTTLLGHGWQLCILLVSGKDLQRRSRLETVSETVSVSTSRRNRDRGVSRPVLSLTKPQDETKMRQTSLVSDCLETVSVLFFLFLGDTGNKPFARPRTKSREGGSGTKARWCPGLTDQEGKAGQCEKPSLGPKGARGGTKVGVENGSSGVELSVEFESRALDLIWSGPTWGQIGPRIRSWEPQFDPDMHLVLNEVQKRASRRRE
ncbi:hypothetical protein PROFUN_17086, partial [Planoprotostelium fungivorum]